MNRTEMAELVASAIDFDGAGLEAGKAHAEAGRWEETFVAYLAHWRTRTDQPRPWTTDYVNEARSIAGDSVTSKAREAVNRWLDNPVPITTHAAFINLGDEVIFLGVDSPEMITRIAEKVFEVEDQWDNSPWGTTDSIIKGVMRLLILPECSDPGVLLPAFAWLVTASRNEWMYARGWGEDNLGNSGHNWWLHTLRGFYLAGLHFPELDGFDRFRCFAMEYFERELRLLMEEDGFTRERSGYHWGTDAHWMSILFHTQVDEGAEFSDAAKAHIRRVAETLWQTAMPYGNMPLWG
ncbi:MAG: heparinase II/III family protein, partial [Planctomycetota bacterium]